MFFFFLGIEMQFTEKERAFKETSELWKKLDNLLTPNRVQVTLI